MIMNIIIIIITIMSGVDKCNAALRCCWTKFVVLQTLEPISPSILSVLEKCSPTNLRVFEQDPQKVLY